MSKYVCPTPCDDDCDAPCHESHQPDFKRMHPVEICEANVASGKNPFPDWYRNPSGCPCAHCEGPYEPTWEEFTHQREYQEPRPPMPTSEDDSGPNMRIATRMMLCRVCGNKRCPAAADHRNKCTGSNEPGQPGSLHPLPVALEPQFSTLDEARDWLAAKTEEAKREHYLANKEDPEEWG